jgi:lipopolysaccharide assembly outer membrane protein LptD (OstA)
MFAMKRVKFLLLFLLIPTLLLAQTSNTGTDKVEETGGIYPTEVQGDDTNEINPQRPDLIKKNLQKPTFTKELRVAAQMQNEIRKNYYVMDGYVDLSYQGMRLQADHAEYDANTKDLVATGNVVLDQTDEHLTGDKLVLNLDTKLGSMYNARGFVPPQIFFWGSRLDKIGDEEYKLYDGVFTECSQIEPHWKLKSTTARMTIDKYIHFTNFTLKAKNLPIFYSPYMMWPIARDRATGFLFPGFGPNSRKGFWVGGSFFWAMSDSYDSTYWVDHYSRRGWGAGSEFRYASSQTENGNIKYYFNDDTELGQEWTLHGDVNQNLPGDFVAKGIVDYFSSFEYIRDYSNTLSRALSLTRGFQGFITKNWSYYSLNFLTNLSERDSGGTSTASFFHLPEVELRSQNQKIGKTPFYFNVLSSADHLGQGRTFSDKASIKNSFQRYDIFPEISWPITYLPWLTVTPSYGYRVTYWSESKDQGGIIDNSLTRHYSDFSFDVRGPNFNRIFDTPNMGYSQKWKHAIEPQVTFQYLSDIPVQDNIIGIDSDVDFIQGTKQVTYSLTNLLYSKRPVKDVPEYESDEYHYYDPEPLEPEAESAWEFISWRLSQTYLFKSDSYDPNNPFQYALLPINSVVRVNPTVNYSIQFTTDYDVNFHQMTRLQLSSTLKSTERWYSNISYVYSNPATPIPRAPGQPAPKAGNSLQTNDGVGLWKNKLALHGDLGYDLTEHNLLGGGVGLQWNADCFSVGVQYRHFSQLFRTDGKENQITFSISLPNIGNLVNFQSGAPAKRY